jgi:hypothetical protein
MKSLPMPAALALPVLALVCAVFAVAAGDAALAASCSDSPDRPGVRAICGIAAPEDIVRIDARHLVVGSMSPANHLYLLDTSADTLMPMDTALTAVDAAGNWGDPACALPESMVLHGLDVARRPGGEQQLLAVNHGGRESVEFFQVVSAAGAAPSLHWRGCVMAADNAQFNDVAALPDGGFLATDPITASWQLPRMLLGALGMNTGRVYRWRPAAGYEPVPHTDSAYPNGILLAPDGQTFFLNRYLDGIVQQHDLDSGEILGSVEIEKPDNSSWSDEGELLVASHSASVFTLLAAVLSEPQERNEIPYAIVAVDPADFSRRTLYRGDVNDLGGGTVAQQQGEGLYIGAFKGDRLIRVIPAAAL